MISSLRDLIQEWISIKDSKESSVHRQKLFVDRDLLLKDLLDLQCVVRSLRRARPGLQPIGVRVDELVRKVKGDKG